MNNFFGNIFKKMMPKNSSEKKTKEEEDLFNEINMSFDVQAMKINEILDSLVIDHKISGIQIDWYILLLIQL